MRAPGVRWSTGGLDPNFMAQVHRILESELLKNGCSATRLAHLFAIHRRTLNRHLSAEGKSFRQVADAVRFEIARRLLAEPSTTIAQVAAVLRFSEPSAFTHAFRRWSGGQTPTAWRAQYKDFHGSQRTEF